MITLEPVQTHTVHQDVQEKIKAYILGNRLSPDTMLPTEAQLAEQLGVSRPVVREALRALESVGVVYSRRGEGRYVKGFELEPIIHNLNYSLLFDMQEARELLQVREHLEESYIIESVGVMDEETLGQLRKIVQRMHIKGSAGELFHEEEREFHTLLYKPMGNRLLTKLLNIFWEVYENLPDRSLHVVEDLDVQAQNHEAIIQAIEAKDGELAKRRLRDHFGSMELRIGPVQEKPQ